MASLRLNLAQVLVGIAVVAAPACSDSHARPDDGGARPDATILVRDGGGPADTAPTPLDTFLPRDAGPVSCLPELVSVTTCETGCDGPPRYHWDGERCFAIGCGECEGIGCDGGFGSMGECEAAHATCVPSLCRATGGTWMFWAEECEHRRCGEPGLAICETGMPVCDCGPTDVFDDVMGCVPSIECSEPGPERTREQLCVDSGGAWEGTCCDSVCGEPCALACAAPACTCGAYEVFDEVRGCIDAAQCHRRAEGESCGLERQSCDRGLVCCDTCGGPGCPVGGRPACRSPVCDGSEDFCGLSDFGG